MDGNPEQRRSSAWPIVAAFGIVATEAGVLFGLVVISVGGVLAVGASCAAMIHEAGYATDPWRPLRFFGVAVAVLSALVWILAAAAITPAALASAAATDGIAVRAAIVLGAAVILVFAGFTGPVLTEIGNTSDRNPEF